MTSDRLVLLPVFALLAMLVQDGALQDLEARFCCQEGETLTVRDQFFEGRWDERKKVVKCASRRGTPETPRGLEGVEVWAGGERGERKVLRELEVKLPSCKRGLTVTSVVTNSSNPESHFRTAFALSSVTLNGSLALNSSTITSALIPQGEFCLTQNAITLTKNDELYEHEGVQAVFCDPCTSQVLCYYLSRIFEGISTSRRDEEIQISVDPQRERSSFMSESIVAIADSNDDSIVDFEEFREKMNDYIGIAYRVLDKNDDNSISEEVKAGNILTRYSLEFFEKALVHVMDFFDTNKDKAIAEDDAIFRDIARYSDRNEDGVISLSEVLGTSLISLPAPLHNLYTKLDRNKDERLSQEEAIDFIKRTFAIIDSNSDCFVDDDEVVALFKKLDLPWDRTLAIKLLLQRYLTMASVIMEQFVAKADKDKDDHVTVEEVIGFEDFDFKDKIISIVIRMGAPSGAFFHLIDLGSRERRGEDTLEVGLNALQDLMEQAEYSDPSPATTCAGYKGLGLPGTPFLKSINA